MKNVCTVIKVDFDNSKETITDETKKVDFFATEQEQNIPLSSSFYSHENNRISTDTTG